MDEESIRIYNSLFGQYVTIVGERREKYIGQVCEGFNCNFKYLDKELTRDIICLESNGHKYEIAMENSYGECGSGWTTASWGHLKIREVKDFGKLTHKAKNSNSIKVLAQIDESDLIDERFEIACREDGLVVLNDELDINTYFLKDYSKKPKMIFHWEPIGGDIYYPNGGYRVNDDFFVEVAKEEEREDDIMLKQDEEKKDDITPEQVEEKKDDITPEQLEKAKQDFLTFFRSTMPDGTMSKRIRPKIVMNDGEFMSVQASEFHYCLPRVGGLTRYECYEIGFPSKLFDEIKDRGEEPDTIKTVFPGVEEDVIISIIAHHGGIDFEKSLGEEKAYKVFETTKKDISRATLEQLSEMATTLSKLLEEYRKQVEQMRSNQKSINPSQNH